MEAVIAAIERGCARVGFDAARRQLAGDRA